MKKHTADPKELVKNRKELVEAMSDRCGYLYCERCMMSGVYKFHVHHIVYRSEAPNHDMLHNKKNLIIVCNVCHDKFHSNKSIRNELLVQRGLDQIFNINV